MTFGTTLGHFYPEGIQDLVTSDARGRGLFLKVYGPVPWSQPCSSNLAKLPGMRRKGLGGRPLTVVSASVARDVLAHHLELFYGHSEGGALPRGRQGTWVSGSNQYCHPQGLEDPVTNLNFLIGQTEGPRPDR